MFIGEHTHALDEKKRLTLPKKFRKLLGRVAVITRGLDGCLFLYPAKEWAGIASKFGSLSMGQSDTRGLARYMLAGAVEAEIDAVGRVLVPEHLREAAAIRSSVVVAGVYGRIELWDEARWKAYSAKVAKDADQMAEKLGQVGAI